VLPFTSVTPYGLEFNAVIHEVIATALELRNPGLACELRRRATDDRCTHWATAVIAGRPAQPP
jgi:hypothetical protein